MMVRKNKKQANVNQLPSWKFPLWTGVFPNPKNFNYSDIWVWLFFAFIFTLYVLSEDSKLPDVWFIARILFAVWIAFAVKRLVRNLLAKLTGYSLPLFAWPIYRRSDLFNGYTFNIPKSLRIRYGLRRVSTEVAFIYVVFDGIILFLVAYVIGKLLNLY